MKKFLVISIIGSFLFLCTSMKSFASGNFDTSANVIYTVRDTEPTHATFTITLTNITSQYYASSYNFMVGFNSIENVKATDPGGLVRTEVTKKDTGNLINLTFNKHVIGFGKKLVFTIEFDTPDVSRTMGTIREINIPGLANQDQFEDFHVHVDVPKNWGKPVYTKPDSLSDTFDFSKEELSQSGISIGFGKEQIYQFNLTYHLTNKNVFPVKTEIALPPSTNYQEVSIKEINPAPDNVIQDEDGNWLAQYILMPSKTMDIIAKGSAVLTMQPGEEYLTDDDRKTYLQEEPYWQVNDVKIQQLAKDLKTPQAIYQYVVNSLTYDFTRVSNDQERVGAAGVLQNPKSAVCLEFTDLFITLARAAGIPAREVDGYAYTENSKERPLSLVKDILHAWPEYYDTQKHQWIMVDPTWQNTTKGIDYFNSLDFDHFAFTIKGKRSDYPIAAGGYKLTGQENRKDIGITFEDTPPENKSSITGTVDLHSSVFGNNISGTIVLKNTGSAAIPMQKVAVLVDTLEPTAQTIYTPTIPPFGHVELPVSFNKPTILTKQDVNLTIQVGNKEIKQNARIQSLLSTTSLLIGGIIIGSISITLFIITKGTRYLLLRRRSR